MLIKIMVLHYSILDYVNYVIVQGFLPSRFGARHVVSAFFRFKAKESKELNRKVKYCTL
jgi:hypothetical protein